MLAHFTSLIKANLNSELTTNSDLTFYIQNFSMKSFYSRPTAGSAIYTRMLFLHSIYFSRQYSSFLTEMQWLHFIYSVQTFKSTQWKIDLFEGREKIENIWKSTLKSYFWEWNSFQNQMCIFSLNWMRAIFEKSWKSI